MNSDFQLEQHGKLAYLTIPAFTATNLVNHCFTTRLGGFSQAPFQSLNMALHVGDNPEVVARNRREICSAIGINHLDLVAGEQVHGENIRVAVWEDKGRGAALYKQALLSTDALITRMPGVPLSTYYADCVPIFILDPVTPAIGLAHAGWKGTVLKIGAKTVLRMQAEFGSQPDNCLIGIGPSIGPCCYEVDGRVVERLAANFNVSEQFLQPAPRGKWLLNLWHANAYALQEVGVKAEHISYSRYCTSCNTELFFSYRAEQGKTGRMAALLMLK
ncbi:peptidoglycan editing factor PgeF [Zhaonella formicivorans]|uniref:peptidoglycan editing factor PgeF n=1 Tax=Zhaonella formicivorans TaxID=2528593 RepID=UPI0010D308BE|nr:peptidoglycan editing factor PgeF [Zhaonella formicivorans]